VVKIVVIGGSGRVGGNVVRRPASDGHDAVAASPAAGVHTITGESLAEVMVGAEVVVAVSNAPVWDDDAVRTFFTTSTRNLLAAEREAGVEVGAPEALGVDGWGRRLFAATGDERTVIGDPHARYFGTELDRGELTPGDGARIGAIDFEMSFATHSQGARR
jgi:uncharacterized protein YbjT (DUF2867 family)